MSDFIDVSGNLVKKGLKYAKTHEWIDLSSSPSKVGISDFAQRSLHDVVYADLPKVGQAVKRGLPLCTLESIKAVAEVYSPVDGMVVEVNSELESKPELVNKDPYGNGWLVKLQVTGGTDGLLGAEEYSDLVRKQL
ncbi:MAG: glycine cleavage system protein GcvH [Candidatus Methanosuratincola sp.]|jgi:glycine cleavage system H protein|nr:glycine cleavage system protein GcvH [Candidatus Methanosuratincola sp.]